MGVNINKLDKGCLIFNTNKEDCYVVSVVDNSNRGEAKYWVEDGESVILYGGGYKYCSRPDYHHPSWCTTKELEECYDKVLKKI